MRRAMRCQRAIQSWVGDWFCWVNGQTPDECVRMGSAGSPVSKARPGAPRISARIVESYAGLWSEESVGGLEDFFGLNGHEAGLGFRVASVVAAAFGAAQHSKSSPIRAVPAGVCGAVNADHRTTEGAGKMEGAGVAGDAEGDAAGEGDELGEGWSNGLGFATGCAGDCVCQRLLARTGVHQNAEASLQEPAGDGGVRLDGPAFCAPPGTGI